MPKRLSPWFAMPPEIRHETQRAVTIHFGPVRMVAEREVTIITDLRDTPFGIYDFGSVTHGPLRWVRDHD